TIAGLRTRLSLAPAWVPPAAVAVGATLACVVLATLDPRKEGFYPRCPFRAVTGRACAGCGVTRGLHELLTGHPMAALRLNVLVFDLRGRREAEVLLGDDDDDRLEHLVDQTLLLRVPEREQRVDEVGDAVGQDADDRDEVAAQRDTDADRLQGRLRDELGADE